jgi:hypothetical protein
MGQSLPTVRDGSSGSPFDVAAENDELYLDAYGNIDPMKRKLWRQRSWVQNKGELRIPDNIRAARVQEQSAQENDMACLSSSSNSRADSSPNPNLKSDVTTYYNKATEAKLCQQFATAGNMANITLSPSAMLDLCDTSILASAIIFLHKEYTNQVYIGPFEPLIVRRWCTHNLFSLLYGVFLAFQIASVRKLALKMKKALCEEVQNIINEIGIEVLEYLLA